MHSDPNDKITKSSLELFKQGMLFHSEPPVAEAAFFHAGAMAALDPTRWSSHGTRLKSSLLVHEVNKDKGRSMAHGALADISCACKIASDSTPSDNQYFHDILQISTSSCFGILAQWELLAISKIAPEQPMHPSKAANAWCCLCVPHPSAPRFRRLNSESDGACAIKALLLDPSCPIKNREFLNFCAQYLHAPAFARARRAIFGPAARITQLPDDWGLSEELLINEVSTS